MIVPARISLRLRRARATRLHDYVVRFVFGGLVCVAAGVIATAFGPRVGGLLLAFPAILPASLTLIASHTRSGRSAGADALGSTFGALGLAAFASVLWATAQHVDALATLLLASVGWLVAAFAGWAAFERYRRHRKRLARGPLAGGRRRGEVPGDWHVLCTYSMQADSSQSRRK